MLTEKVELECLRVYLMGDSSYSTEDKKVIKILPVNIGLKGFLLEGLQWLLDSNNVCYSLAESLSAFCFLRLCLRLTLKVADALIWQKKFQGGLMLEWWHDYCWSF